MSEIIDFLKENSKTIFIIIIAVFFLLVVLKIKDINLNTKKTSSKLIQQVTVETFNINTPNVDFSELKNQPSELFCNSYLGNSLELENGCNQLTESNCANVKCCIFGNNKCVAGDINGPTYKTNKDGSLITMDSFYYLGKKYPQTES